ncbi:metallophosphoesterase [Bacillus thuringiensis]|uniref:Calcineurin-like phosphoesterase domain-containing protein n=1 Tax=Bacillus cereus TaxID=1396 RepID=A0A9W7PZA6_BACCE|nr:metallophosphoesterase [Bacillus cereus]KAA6448387.1 hypothetical protein DX932_31030 [Bacillus cereus]KAB2500201.1 hypothetical protein F8156_20860 [Bacillus cereus]
MLEKNTRAFATSDILQAFVISSDPQYPWTAIMDDRRDDRDKKIIKQESEALIREQYQSINSYTDTISNSYHIINGDITAFGHPGERTDMRKFLKVLKKPYFYGLGNHDIENNKDDCYADRCFRGSMGDYVDYLSSIKGHIISKDYVNYGNIFTYGYSGSFAYAMVFHNLLFIQLNNDPTMETSNTKYNPGFIMKSNLNWLEDMLKLARERKYIPIINVHKPDDWKKGPNERFKQLLKDYNVPVVFAGHYHKKCGKYSYTSYFGNIPVCISGSASQKTYLILEQTKERINIYKVINNNWANKTLIHQFFTVPVGTTIKTALCDSVITNRDGVSVELNTYNALQSQHWKLVYRNDKNAYQIFVEGSNSLVLAGRYFGPGSMTLFITENEYKDEHYWILEETNDGYVIIKNYKDTSLVFDVREAKCLPGTYIQLFKQRSLNDPLITAQKFKFIEPKVLTTSFKEDSH